MTNGLADTSVIIDWNKPNVHEALPEEVSISTITLAELAAGPHFARDSLERARRQARLQWAEAVFEAMPFDVAAARSFGEIVSAVRASGRSHRSRTPDLLIASIAHANRLALYTRNPQDFVGLEPLIDVHSI